MSDDLSNHQPSAEARRRANAAGVDLDAARRDDPVTYRMLCSVPLLTVGPALAEEVELLVQQSLPDQQLFQARLAEKLLLLAFPGPGPDQLRLLDDSLAHLAEKHSSSFAYFREVNDRNGSRREVDLPLEPSEWKGHAAASRPREALVGPFDSEAVAREWGSESVDGGSGFTFDVIHYAGAWFCDVFYAAEA